MTRYDRDVLDCVSGGGVSGLLRNGANVTDYRTLFGKEHLGSWDLPRDVTLTIERVTQGELRVPGGKKVDKRPIVHFQGTPKTLVLNATNGKAIASIYSPQVETWSGKRITIYATTTAFGGETVPCIRVRPAKPPARGGGALATSPPVETVIEEDARDVAPETDDNEDTP